jgi:hypothetical protein
MNFAQATRECTTAFRIFFAGKAIVVLSHGITKEREVPNEEIDRAIKRKEQVARDFKRYAFKPE